MGLAEFAGMMQEEEEAAFMRKPEATMTTSIGSKASNTAAPPKGGNSPQEMMTSSNGGGKKAGDGGIGKAGGGSDGVALKGTGAQLARRPGSEYIHQHLGKKQPPTEDKPTTSGGSSGNGNDFMTNRWLPSHAPPLVPMPPLPASRDDGRGEEEVGKSKDKTSYQPIHPE